MRIHILIDHQILHALDDDNRVVDNQTDSQNHRKKSQNIDVKAQQIDDSKGGNQRNRNGNQRYQRGLELLQKDVCDKHDQRKGYDQRFDNAGNRGADIIG